MQRQIAIISTLSKTHSYFSLIIIMIHKLYIHSLFSGALSPTGHVQSNNKLGHVLQDNNMYPLVLLIIVLSYNVLRYVHYMTLESLRGFKMVKILVYIVENSCLHGSLKLCINWNVIKPCQWLWQHLNNGITTTTTTFLIVR